MAAASREIYFVVMVKGKTQAIYIAESVIYIRMLIIICQRTRRRHNVATILGGREVRSCPKKGRNMAKIVQIKKNKASTHGKYVESSENASSKRWNSVCLHQCLSLFEQLILLFRFAAWGVGDFPDENAGPRMRAGSVSSYLWLRAPSSQQQP